MVVDTITVLIDTMQYRTIAARLHDSNPVICVNKKQ